MCYEWLFSLVGRCALLLGMDGATCWVALVGVLDAWVTRLHWFVVGATLCWRLPLGLVDLGFIVV